MPPTRAPTSIASSQYSVPLAPTMTAVGRASAANIINVACICLAPFESLSHSMFVFYCVRKRTASCISQCLTLLNRKTTIIADALPRTCTPTTVITRTRKSTRSQSTVIEPHGTSPSFKCGASMQAVPSTTYETASSEWDGKHAPSTRFDHERITYHTTWRSQTVTRAVESAYRESW